MKWCSSAMISQRLIYVYETDNAGKNIWLRAQTLNQKLKENAQTQDVDSRQGLEVISQH